LNKITTFWARDYKVVQKPENPAHKDMFVLVGAPFFFENKLHSDFFYLMLYFMSNAYNCN